MFHSNTEIQKRATEIFMQDQERTFSNVAMPEVSELKESGIWDKAKKELECSAYSPVKDMTGQEVTEFLNEIDQGKQALEENEKLREEIKNFKKLQPQTQTPSVLSFFIPHSHMTVKYATATETPTPKPKAPILTIICRYAKIALRKTKIDTLILICLTLLWLAFTYGVISNFSLTWMTVAGCCVLWIPYLLLTESILRGELHE